MSTTFRFVDAQNKTARPIWAMVVAEQDLKRLENYNNQQKTPDPKITQAIDALRQLPVKGLTQTGAWAAGNLQVYAVANAENFAHKTQVNDANNTPLTVAEMNASFAQIKAALAAADVLNKMRETTEGFPVISLKTLALKRAIKLQNKIEQGLLTLFHVTAKNEFASTASFALFAAVRYQSHSSSDTLREGYLTSQHMLKGLSEAKLFPSEEAAELHIKKARLLNHFGTIQLVRVNTSIQSLGKTIVGTNSSSWVSDLGNSRIQEAVAFVQQEQLEHALQEASRERLEQRLKEMGVEEDTPSTPRKRM